MHWISCGEWVCWSCLVHRCFVVGSSCVWDVSVMLDSQSFATLVPAESLWLLGEASHVLLFCAWHRLARCCFCFYSIDIALWRGFWICRIMWTYWVNVNSLCAWCCCIHWMIGITSWQVWAALEWEGAGQGIEAKLCANLRKARGTLRQGQVGVNCDTTNNERLL